MKKILGLDLGTNSIGWAVVKKEGNNCEISGIGSRIFPEGVEKLGSGEKEISKNVSRREARGKRRQIFRKKLRKRYLLNILSKNNLCPISLSLIKKSKGNDFFGNETLKNWFKLNPYKLRADAIKKEVSLHELGRIFYHMIQRRGFQSNSRNAPKESGKIFKGEGKEGKTGIDETEKEIANKKTLGSYLNYIYPKEKESYSGDSKRKRIRNRYTTRQMYIKEFEEIWKNQEKHYPKELTKELKESLGRPEGKGYSDGVLFYQRPLRSQKHLIGNCTFEQKKTRCHISAIPFEKYRIRQWINNLKYENKQLSGEEKEKVFNEILSYKKSPNNLKEKLTKLLKKPDSTKFNYDDNNKVPISHTIRRLKDFFGKKWENFSEKEQEDIWHNLDFFDDKSKLKEYAMEKWKFDEEKAKEFSEFTLKKGYSNLSRKAIKNILIFLEEGHIYNVAVGLAGVKNALGDSKDQEKILKDAFKIIESAENKKGGYIEPLKEMLKNKYSIPDKNLKKLYHHSSNIEKKVLQEKLPVNNDKEIQNIKNPVVMTALFELRKLINELIDTHEFDEIKVELARDLKASKEERNEISKQQAKFERKNEKAKEDVEGYYKKYNKVEEVTKRDILKYRLWEECNKKCPYTGKGIGFTDLFGEEAKVQIEHIVPYSKSLNNSFINKTLCFADENRDKGNKTPFEYYGAKERWEEIKSRVEDFKFEDQENKSKKDHPKYIHFIKEKHDDDFITRQLNDTRYISKQAKNYLSKICENIKTNSGKQTARLRSLWKLNYILNYESNTKDRGDHRHHAIDALVVACVKQKYIKKLKNMDPLNNYKDDFPKPWDNFEEDATKAVKSILVSHRKDNKLITFRKNKVKKEGKIYENIGIAIRGILHKETLYGERTAPNSEAKFHYRVPVSELKGSQINKIVDKTIRELFEKRNGEDQLSLVNNKKGGKPVPIKKVRVWKNIGLPERLKGEINQYVETRNNHHVLIYRNTKGEIAESVVTFWTAVERKIKKQPVFQLPEDGEEIITTLEKNDMFLLDLSEEDINDINWEKPNNDKLKDNLYRVQKISSKYYTFRLHSDTSKDSGACIRMQSLTKFEYYSPIKVKVSVTGKIRKQ